MPFKKGHNYNRGRKRSQEFKDKIARYKTGTKLSVETRQKISLKKSGKNHWNWQGGVNSINNKIRHSLEYRLWREAVFKRDNYICIWCKEKKSGRLQADHIKPFAYFPELRFAIDNGRTLCVDCHKKTDTYLKKMSL